jgi:hypothetical protein
LFFSFFLFFPRPHFLSSQGIGTDEKAVISVICERPKDYLQFLRQEYPKHHKTDLVHLIEKETSGNLERVLVACLWTDAENRARFLHDAVKGAGTDETALIDCLCTALPSQIRAVKEAWHHRYPLIKMETRVKSEVSGHFQEVLEAVMHDKRPESGVDAAHMEEDLEHFYKATEGKIGTDEKALAKIIKHRSREHLWALNEAYKHRSKKGRSAVEVIQAETSGHLERALCAAFLQPAAWYARAIHLSMKGAGTDEHALIRNVFLPMPFELKMARDILSTFYKASGFVFESLAKPVLLQEDLVKRVKSELSGDFERAMIAYIEFTLSH